MTEDKKLPIIYLVIMATIVIVGLCLTGYFLHWHWPYVWWFGYTKPSLLGNGPEAVIELILVGTATALLIPAVRHFFQHGWHALHAKIDAHHAEAKSHREKMSQHMEDAAKDREALHKKLDAVHLHLGIEKPKRVRKPAVKSPGPLRSASKSAREA